SGSRIGHLVRQYEADPRRAAIFGALRVPTRARIAARARTPARGSAAHHLTDGVRVAARSRSASALADSPGTLLLRSHRRAQEASRFTLHRSYAAAVRRFAARGSETRIRLFRLLGGRQQARH